MPAIPRLRSKIPVVMEFLKRLKKEKPRLYNMITPGDDTLTVIRKLAKEVGYDKEIKESDRIVDVLNAIWPLIVEY